MMDIYRDIPLYHASDGPGGIAAAAAIRLLELHPAKLPDEDIKCDLLVSNLDECEPFEALSYTWGSTGDPVTIHVTINGKEHSVKVTQNLAAALRRLRRADDRTRLLWADALCINQADNSEKSRQVQQMRQVYTGQRTTRVVVWLGDAEHEKPGMALDFLEEIRSVQERGARKLEKVQEFFQGKTGAALVEAMGELMQRLNDSGMAIKDFADTAASSAEREFLEHIANASSAPEEEDPMSPLLYGCQYDAKWAACERLFRRRQWWQRTWILQEVMHAGEAIVYVGKAPAPVPLDELCRAAMQYYTLLHIRESFRRRAALPPVSAFDFEVWLRSCGAAETVASNILATRSDTVVPMPKPLRRQEASDPLDKIYGLLGMSRNEYDIVPDYTMKQGQLYTLVTRHLLASGRWEALLWVEHPSRDISSANANSPNEPLPSWVIDHTTRQSFRAIAMAQHWQKFGANKDFPPLAEEPHLVQDGRTLMVPGIRVGTVTEVREDRITDDEGLKGEDSVPIFGWHHTSTGQSYSLDNADGTRGLGSFRNSSWGPSGTAAGDIIIVAARSNVPLVLRQVCVAGEKEYYLFVGGCWLIESEIGDLGKIQEESVGFSPVMFGSGCACSGDKSAPTQVEVFAIR